MYTNKNLISILFYFPEHNITDLDYNCNNPITVINGYINYIKNHHINLESTKHVHLKDFIKCQNEYTSFERILKEFFDILPREDHEYNSLSVSDYFKHSFFLVLGEKKDREIDLLSFFEILTTNSDVLINLKKDNNESQSYCWDGSNLKKLELDKDNDPVFKKSHHQYPDYFKDKNNIHNNLLTLNKIKQTAKEYPEYTFRKLNRCTKMQRKYKDVSYYE